MTALRLRCRLHGSHAKLADYLPKDPSDPCPLCGGQRVTLKNVTDATVIGLLAVPALAVSPLWLPVWAYKNLYENQVYSGAALVALTGTVASWSTVGWLWAAYAATGGPIWASVGAWLAVGSGLMWGFALVCAGLEFAEELFGVDR